MESIFGMVGNGFTLLVSDQSAIRSIMTYKQDEDKIYELSSTVAAAAAGPQADCVQFIEYIQRNIALNEFRSSLKMSTKAIASFTRSELAKALRKNPYQVNLLLGGSDALYYLDYVGSAQSLNYAAHGYAAYFILSTMDAHWKPGMSVDECLEVARKCIKELSTRFIVNQPNFLAKIVTPSGIKLVDLAQQ